MPLAMQIVLSKFNALLKGETKGPQTQTENGCVKESMYE